MFWERIYPYVNLNNLTKCEYKMCRTRTAINIDLHKQYIFHCCLQEMEPKTRRADDYRIFMYLYLAINLLL